MSDSLGDRMKTQYENRTRYYLPRRTYTICRIDGKSFHTYTKGLQKPYDPLFNSVMDETAKYVLSIIDGGQFVYTQSDEISILMTDFAELDTQAWFDGNLQKICSVAASAAAAMFNSTMCEEFRVQKLGCFDARVFTIPDRNEVANYFLWRTRDCMRNSINALGQFYYSNAQLHGKNTGQVGHAGKW